MNQQYIFHYLGESPSNVTIKILDPETHHKEPLILGQWTVPIFSIWNRYTKPLPIDLNDFVVVLQNHISGPYFSAWNQTVNLRVLTKDEHPDPADWVVVLVDRFYNLPALGYHELNPTGFPLGYVGVDNCIDQGGVNTLTQIITHEVLESIGNPWTDKWLQGYDRTSNAPPTLWARENCDADQMMQVFYEGYALTNWQTPAWWDPRNTTGPYDYLGSMSKPFEVSPGGYMTIRVGRTVGTVFGPKPGNNFFFSFKLEEHPRIQMLLAGRENLTTTNIRV